MKIHFERDGTIFEYERHPLPEGRFRVVCNLVGAAIGGAVLLGAIHLVGFWAIPWSVGALVAVGLYKLMKDF